MDTNEGIQDRLIRVTLGLFFILLAWSSASSSIWITLTIIVGLVMTVTGAVGFCPLYKVLKLNSCGNR